MKSLFTTSALFIFFLLVMASCQSSQPAFSKRGEEYRSAREIAAAKRAAKKTKGKREANRGVAGTSKDRTSRTRIPKRDLDTNIATVIETARSFTGVPYRWGGTTRVGMDCSGLLCTSFQSINVDLPRTSEEQSRFGIEVKPTQLREGDLVFFGPNRRNITHVGMVTEVNGANDVRFIHSSTSLGVIENNLYSDYYQKMFIKAVRPPVFDAISAAP